MAKYSIRKCTAAITAAFLLSAMSTIDRHDEHLNDVVVVQYQNKAEASQQYVDLDSSERRATVMDAALMLDPMQLTTSTKIHYVQKVVGKKGERLVKKSVSITHRFCPFCGEDKQKHVA